jgi:hypothetical protein
LTKSIETYIIKNTYVRLTKGYPCGEPQALREERRIPMITVYKTVEEELVEMEKVEEGYWNGFKKKPALI